MLCLLRPLTLALLLWIMICRRLGLLLGHRQFGCLSAKIVVQLFGLGGRHVVPNCDRLRKQWALDTRILGHAMAAWAPQTGSLRLLKTRKTDGAGMSDHIAVVSAVVRVDAAKQIVVGARKVGVLTHLEITRAAVGACSVTLVTAEGP